MSIINTVGSGGGKTIAGEKVPEAFPTTYDAPEGYDGWSSLTIAAPDNLSAENIAVDKTIAGVTGTYRGRPHDFYMANMFISGNERKTHSSAEGISELTLIKDPNLKAVNIKKGVRIDGFMGTYEPSLTTEEGTITEFPMTYTTPEGYDGMSTVIAHAPETLVAGNIKKGVEIANITGTYEPALQAKSTKAASFPVTVEPESDYYGLSQASVTAPDNLEAKNIKAGVSIAGIEGTYEGGSASDKFVELCNGTITSVTEDDLAGATKLKDYIFAYCKSLKSITIPSSITVIPQYFAYSTAITSFDIPDSVTEIQESAFAACLSLTTIYIPDSVKTLRSGIFSQDTSLVSIRLPSDITNLPVMFLYSCIGLSELTVPAKVTSFEMFALYNTTGLKSLIMLPETPPTIGNLAIDGWPADIVITVPKGCLEAYKSATTWSAYGDNMVEASE